MAQRPRDAGMALGLARDFRHMPPIDTLFLHRKLGGLFLLASRLKARVNVRVNVRELALPYLTAATSSSGCTKRCQWCVCVRSDRGLSQGRANQG